MGRWQISDPDRERSPEPRVPQEGQRKESKDKSASARAGGSSDRDGELSRLSSRGRDRGVPVERAQRPKLLTRERRIVLRRSQIQAMSEIGTFRTVETTDLARFAY